MSEPKTLVRVLNTHVCAEGAFIPVREVAQAFLDMANTIKESTKPLTAEDCESALREMFSLFTDIGDDYDAEMALRSVRRDIPN